MRKYMRRHMRKAKARTRLRDAQSDPGHRFSPTEFIDRSKSKISYLSVRLRKCPEYLLHAKWRPMSF